MKKLLFTTLTVFLLVNNIVGQGIAYYDAIYLNSVITQNNGKFQLNIETRKIFNLYIGNLDGKLMENEIENNPFLAPYYARKGSQGASNAKKLKSYMSNSLGSIDVTNFANGVSLFLIERARQELNIAFFQRFKKFVDKNPEIQIIFPNTYASLGNLLAYQYSQMLPVLQDAFYKDMEELPQNLVEVLKMNKKSNLLNNNELIIAINALTMVQQINQMNPAQFINLLPEITDGTSDTDEIKNLNNSLSLTTIFTNSIRTKENDSEKFWVSPSEFYNNILQNETTFNIFLGLLYQKIKYENIEFNYKPFINKMENSKEQIKFYKTQFTSLLTQVDKINNAANNIEQSKTKSEKPTNYNISSYIEITLDLFDFGYKLALYNDPESSLKTKNISSYIEMVKYTNRLYINTVGEKYSLAINDALLIIKTFNKLVIDDCKFEKESIFNSKTIEGLTTYGTFIANMADANSPQEVQAAIESAALPAGSSSFKKNYRNNIALNAYLGANMGNWPKEKSSSTTWNNDFRLAAPIGFTWTPFSFGKGGSLSLFASVLDVGAIVSYQLVNDTTVDQKIYLSNIFSPGGYIVYGMAWNIPLSVGFGTQYGPGLIKIGDNIWNPSLRWNFFITFDIPIFNLNKGKGLTK